MHTTFYACLETKGCLKEGQGLGWERKAAGETQEEGVRSMNTATASFSKTETFYLEVRCGERGPGIS